ncbi:alpha/beta hydrolase [Sphingomonas sp. RP10(2022)]|uniref:Alpha/beta hydrolase n=1 Tax=Sphingomonas liriopis TaxID=2949094 RepID=A0A9X2HY70_9SPHN|nr:alpha/beta hydrolase [Sphingomonas liriopis]MCP3735574.1 alpha/beta hydrolase [Sphingomonas liriopis]
MIDRRHALLGALAAGVAARLAAQTPAPRVAGAAGVPADPVETIDLWPGQAPGMPAVPPVEIVDARGTDPQVPDRAVRGVVRPRLAVFRPAVPNGAALLVTPGGGYARIVVDKEGYEVARWLAKRGWTVFVLFYRLPGDGWAAGPDIALSDAQRAMRLIRARAADYRIRPDRVAAMGFSAGGHVCGDLATRFAAPTYAPVDAADRLSARPDLAAPIYAVQSMTLPLAHPGSRELLLGRNASPALEAAHSPARNVGPGTPPCFLVHAEDDATVPVDNTLQFRAALKAAGVPVETHLFAIGGHGFGLRRAAGKPVAAWPSLFVAWAQSHGWA